MSEFRKFGEGDLHVQLLIAMAADWQAATTNKMMSAYDMDVAFAVQATALGQVAGRVQALYEQHSQECESCAAKKHNIYELIIKNFEASFARAKREQEEIHEMAASNADALLEQLFKGHKK